MENTQGLNTVENASETTELPRSLQLAMELEQATDKGDEILKSKLKAFLESMELDLNVHYTDNANELYARMREENCLVRVEKLSRVLETLELDKDLHISDEDEYHYANATLPIPEGIKIAFAEGQAPGIVRIAVGFGKTIIGFKTDNIEVSEVEFSNRVDSEERRYLCRHVVGDIKREDIISVVMRIPRHLMEDSLLNEKELESKSPFIVRGFNTGSKK